MPVPAPTLQHGRDVEAHGGHAIYAPLRELDQVAYLQFAGAYQGFESLDDFESAIPVLPAECAAQPPQNSWHSARCAGSCRQRATLTGPSCCRKPTATTRRKEVMA